MKYCPELSCEHRRRVGSPAEFVDGMTTCSDCGTPLVAGDAPELGDGAHRGDGPYRRLAAPRMSSDEIAGSRDQRNRDQLIGVAFIVGGIVLTAITYAAASSGLGSGTYILAYGPITYGLYRIVRGSVGGSAGKPDR